MALSDDQRNAARGHVEEVSGELGDYFQIVLSVTIEAEQWAAVKASTLEAAAFVAWLADSVED